MRRSSVSGLALAAITLTASLAQAQTQPAAPRAPKAPTAPAVAQARAAQAPAAQAPTRTQTVTPRQTQVVPASPTPAAPAAEAPLAKQTSPVAARPLQGLSDTALPPDEELLAAPPVAPAAGTRLNLRTAGTKPLELAPEPAGEGMWWKLLAGTVLLGAGAFAMKKKGLLGKGNAKGRAFEEPPTLRVLARTTLAQKGELVVACVDGQRFLLGVTGQNIVRLAMLSPDASEHEGLALMSPASATPASEETIVPGVEFERLLGMVASSDKPRDQDPKKATPPPTVHREELLEEHELPPIDQVVEQAIGEAVVAQEMPAPTSSRPRVKTRAARAYAAAAPVEPVATKAAPIEAAPARVVAAKVSPARMVGGTQALSLKQLRQRRAG